MEIMEIKNRELLINQLVVLWQDSITTTHTFLSNFEIENIKKYVPEILRNISHLIVIFNGNRQPIGFIGVENRKIEMLFIKTNQQKKGFGKKLIEFGIKHYTICEVNVNEQNPIARSFYEHMGFEVYKRSETDEQANPYPILYMKLV